MRKDSKILFLGILFLSSLGIGQAAAQEALDWRPKFRIEVGAGWLFSSFGDLTLIKEADDATQKFFYDDRYTWMFLNKKIISWTLRGREEGEGFSQLKNAYPWDIRLRFQAPWDLVTFSVGFRSFSRSLNQKIPIEFERTVSAGEAHIESLTYNPYRLSYNSYAVPFTLYYNMTEGMVVDASLYISAGPCFANALYEKSWTEGFEKIIQGERGLEAPAVNHSLRMEGHGWGLFAEAGLRFDINLGNLFSIYTEGGYIYQGIFSLQGNGRQVIGSSEENWEGKWMIRTKNLTEAWGSSAIYTIDSRPSAGSTGSAEKTFLLSTGGFSIRGGLSIRF